ncbi:MAG: DUF362 domain-containing protein [Oscillospiraceae bacterium]|nr:DUF362 domain-containing protein [Oscillospiraceae bacterium]
MITINYSSDILNGTLKLLKASSLDEALYGVSKTKHAMRVSIKPNMVLARHPSEGATTHAEVVEGIIIFLREHGIRDIEIIESAWLGDNTKRVYKVCGYDKLSEKYNVPIHDLKDDKVRRVQAGEYNFEIFEKALDTDFLINVPVLKAHCQTRMTCCFKNLKGCISDREKRRFHEIGLHKPIAYLNKAIKTHFCVVDGICGDLSFEEGGNPITRNMLLCGENPFEVDCYCAGLLGYAVDEIEYLQEYMDLREHGRTQFAPTDIVEINADKKPVMDKPDGGLVQRLAANVIEDKACSACYSALINGLNRVHYRGGKIAVGQGFKGKSGISGQNVRIGGQNVRIGCGNCTSGFDKFIKGCPPSAVEVSEFLRTVD